MASYLSNLLKNETDYTLGAMVFESPSSESSYGETRTGKNKNKTTINFKNEYDELFDLVLYYNEAAVGIETSDYTLWSAPSTCKLLESLSNGEKLSNKTNVIEIEYVPLRSNAAVKYSY